MLVGRRGATGGERVNSVDALRGVSAIGVAWFHVYTQNGGALAGDAMPHFFNTVSAWGRWGVQLFFVISGFVVAYTMLHRRDITSAGDIGRYFLRRSVRLDPTYWACLVIALATMPILFAVSRNELVHLFPNFAPSAACFLKNILYFLPIGGDLYMPVAWTLALEVHFYILFAAIVVVVNRMETGLAVSRASATLVLVAALLVVWVLTRLRLLPAEDNWLTYHLASFILGILSACALRMVRYSRLALALAFIIVSALFVRLRENDIAATVLTGLIVVLAVFAPRIRAALRGSSILVKLGALSYCIYLLHQPIGGLTVGALQTFVSRSTGAHQTAFVAIGIVVTVIFAAMIYRLVERPSIALSKIIQAHSPHR
jgi:peptidoglycan/LPS O-acetylase OafA/YrhL